MPIPDHAFDIEGGCNCGAIRYRVSVPAKDERPFYPGGGKDADPRVRMPLSCTDHCNDCRKATGALLPSWLLTPMYMVSISLVSRTAPTSSIGRLDDKTARGPWTPALDVCRAEEPPNDSFLMFFASSKGRRRSFCGRCGTMFAYQVTEKLKMIEFDMLDLVLGTVDREYLEDEDLLGIEKQLWWGKGIPWVRDMARRAFDVPVHDHWSVAEEVKF